MPVRITSLVGRLTIAGDCRWHSSSNGTDAEYSVIGRVARRIWAVAARVCSLQQITDAFFEVDGQYRRNVSVHMGGQDRPST